jgi:hypothetical protein
MASSLSRRLEEEPVNEAHRTSSGKLYPAWTLSLRVDKRSGVTHASLYGRIVIPKSGDGVSPASSYAEASF